ncbi:MAG TPA: DUF892 family protein [Micromonosporaceae bacterium]
MAVTTQRDLLLYELGAMRDAERTGAQLLRWLGTHVRDGELDELLRRQDHDCHEHLSNIESCLRVIGGSPLETRSEVVEAMRLEYEQLVHTRPSAEALNLFALVTAMQFMHFAVGSYTGLLCCTRLTRMDDCVPSLRENLRQKTASAQALEDIGRRMVEEMPEARGVAGDGARLTGSA